MSPALSTGVDMIEIPRIRRAIARWGERFLAHVYTPAEVRYCRGRVPELAARFAAKEAISKALGTGLVGISWTEMEILGDRRGKPRVTLYGRALARAQRLGLSEWTVSLSHCHEYAVAVIVAGPSGCPQEPPARAAMGEGEAPQIAQLADERERDTMHRLGIIGASGHVHLVFDELARYPQVAYVGYAPSFPEEDVSALARVPSGAPAPRRYDDWRALLGAERPDIVVVAGRYDLNGLLAIEAVRRDCHVLSEKPAARSLEELAALREAVKESGRLYASMLPMRYEPAFWTAHELVQQGAIGTPYLISAQKSYRWGRQRPAWYADRAQYGSTMAWVGIHAFDYARWVSGLDYVQVCAHHANLVHTDRPGCQDVAAVLATLSNGGSAVFHLDYLRPETASSHGDDRLRVAGSGGVLEVCDLGRRLHVINAEGDVAAWPLVEPQRTLFGDLVAAIEGRGSLLVTAEEAFAVTAFAIEAARAADTQTIRRVDWPT